MTTILLVIHVLLAIALVTTVLLQRSEGGGLGIGGGGGMGGLMTSRGTANLLTRTTAVIAALFMGTSLVLAILAGGSQRPQSIVDQPPAAAAPAVPAEPSKPDKPSVPVAQ